MTSRRKSGTGRPRVGGDDMQARVVAKTTCRFDFVGPIR